MQNSIYALNSQKLADIQLSLGQKPSARFQSEIIGQIFRSPHKPLNFKTHISPVLIEHLKQNYNWDLPEISKLQKAKDGTVKFLYRFKDGKEVETVLIPFHNKYSICVSSQVGCAMKCSFCHTGTQGLLRNLSPEEIVLQYIASFVWLRNSGEKKLNINNLVFMGQGEPLHNFENVKKAIDILSDPIGLALGRKKITISTSGYLPGLKKFNELGAINLALSLHSTDQNLRTELIPLNNRYPIKDIFEEIDLITGEDKLVEYEFLLIKDLTCTEIEAKQLIKLLQNRGAVVNLIPFNEFPGSKYKRPTDTEIQTFRSLLVAGGIRTMLRTTKGDDILAACGQLKS